MAADASGDFVIAWDSIGQDGSLNGVFARRFSNAGAPLASEFQVNSYTTGQQRYLSASVDADGDFVVAWHSDGQDGSLNGVFARRFSKVGAPLASEFQVNTYTEGNQGYGSVAADADGDFVVAWSSDGQDGSAEGVFAQRFSRPAILDIDGDGTVGPLTDGLLVLRFLFGFTGATLTSGAVGGGCTRCNSAAIAPYLQALI